MAHDLEPETDTTTGVVRQRAADGDDNSDGAMTDPPESHHPTDLQSDQAIAGSLTFDSLPALRNEFESLNGIEKLFIEVSLNYGQVGTDNIAPLSIPEIEEYALQLLKDNRVTPNLGVVPFASGAMSKGNQAVLRIDVNSSRQPDGRVLYLVRVSVSRVVAVDINGALHRTVGSVYPSDPIYGTTDLHLVRQEIVEAVEVKLSPFQRVSDKM